MPIKRRILIAFALGLSVFLVLGLYATAKYGALSRIVQSATTAPTQQIDAARSAWEAYHRADEYLTRMRAGEAFVPSEIALREFQARVDEVSTQLARLSGTETSANQADVLRATQRLVDQWRSAGIGWLGGETASVLAPHAFAEFGQRIRTGLLRIVWSANAAAVKAQAGVRGELDDMGRVASIVLVLGMVIGGLLTHWFATSITNPIERLCRHIDAIAGARELKRVEDRALLGQPDELGRMARAFDDMIGELAIARQAQLVRADEAIRRQFDRLKSAVDNMPQGLSMFDAERRLIVCNAGFAQIYKLPDGLCVPGTEFLQILRHCASNGLLPVDSPDAETFVSSSFARLEPGQRWSRIYELVDGRSISVTQTPLAEGGWVMTHKDVSERRRREAQIDHLAHHDALTDLPNRVTFSRELDHALEWVAAGETVAVHYVDIDHFKDVNDSYGHEAGDRLLVEIGRRLRACTRDGDVVARLGGDEFAIIQLGCPDAASADILANRVIEDMKQPFAFGSASMRIGASVGVAIAPFDGRDKDELLRHADLALYKAKAAGRGVVRLFESTMNQAVQSKRALDQDLRRAIERDQLKLVYQPQIDVRTGAVLGFEALLRWQHPSRGTVSPLEFVPLAEENGLIGEIGAWVLKTACLQAARWPNDIRVAVNVSPVQLRNRPVELDVMAAIAESGLAQSRLQIEITEAVLMDETEEVIAKLKRMRETGVTIAIDDFGTGYSSLSYLRSFPFDKIKIDKSFVKDICNCEATLAIIRAVNNLATSLGVTITAEGVETRDQLALLISERCREVQGYLFSKPRPPEELAELLVGKPRWAA